MQQQLLNNATYYACGTNKATTPFANALIRLDRLQPPSLKNNRATTPFAKVIIWLDRLQPPSFDNAYVMTQLNTTTTTSYKHIKSTTKDLHINSKTTREINQLSTIFMFMSKSNSKQKRAKKTQELKTGSLLLNNSRGEHDYLLWRAHIWTTR